MNIALAVQTYSIHELCFLDCHAILLSISVVLDFFRIFTVSSIHYDTPKHKFKVQAREREREREREKSTTLHLKINFRRPSIIAA
jgi:hypothetical protein